MLLVISYYIIPMYKKSKFVVFIMAFAFFDLRCVPTMT
uniref:Uncharacterized protein n=1 Tax=Arundo donax TaxID=35708 RepID=A0A0A9H8Q1_ARUDO